MYLIPPMDDEPPHDYVDFVTVHVAELRQEADRLVGGDTEGGHLYVEALSDLAGHWRRLRLISRLLGRDYTVPYVMKRLTTRTEHWRKEQIYEVDVQVLHARHPAWSPIVWEDRSSLALRKAGLIPGTRRGGVILAVADAGIAWVQAYRRQQWRRAGRLAAGTFLVVGGYIQWVSWMGWLGS